MIENTPIVLPRKRLERIVRGLRFRKNSSMQQMAEQVSELRENLSQVEARFSVDIENQTEHSRLEVCSATTDWDEALCERWDAAELKTYRAIFDTTKQEIELGKEATAQANATNEEAQKRATKAERKFLKDKEVPLNQLKNFRNAQQRLIQEANELERQAETAIAQHGLRLPSLDLQPTVAASGTTAKEVFQEARTALVEAGSHYQKLVGNRVVLFLDSIWWWLACGLVMLATTVGLWQGAALSMLTAVLIGSGVTVAVLLGGLIGIRPWLKRIVAAELPTIKQFVLQCQSLCQEAETRAVAENDAELQRLAADRERTLEEIKQWRVDRLAMLQAELNEAVATLRARAEAAKQAASRELTEHSDAVNEQFEANIRHLHQQRAQKEQELRDHLAAQKHRIDAEIDQLQRGGALRLQNATRKALHFVSRSQQWCQRTFPSWSRLSSDNSAWPQSVEEPVIPLGDLPLESVLPDAVSLGASHDNDANDLAAPLLFSPLQDEYLVIEADPALPSVQQLVRNLVMRALTTLPPGKTQVCVVDPPGLGRDFGWLMQLADYDPQLVSHRVWTQPGHIAKQISTLALAAEDFIQQSLRNQYQDIVAYNREAGALAEPFRILVWSSMPAGLEDQSWKNLLSILDTGARCGIIPILVVDPHAAWPTAAHKEAILRRGVHIHFDESSKQFVQLSSKGESLVFHPNEAADDATAHGVISEVGRRAMLSSRVEVPLEKMIPQQEKWWQGDNSRCLDVPIGQSGVGRTHSLRLGVGTAQHAIIAGKTGSGKSSLLHAMITSAIVTYSPERLRLVLLDFKKGVEFQVYAQAQIAHADIIGIESHREFGLSSLEYIDGCMQRRGEAFRQAGVQDLTSWNALHSDQPLPRMMLVIDEFQELFVEDDRLSQQASLILDRIVRQGRSFGVHAVLSSQSLSGAYSLPRTTLGQMAVRIALQCDPSDAQIIFAEDNPAAARLKHPGQAVYNDAGGRIEGNQPMQIGWMPKHSQIDWFARLEKGYRNSDSTTNRLGRTVIYDGNRAANWDAANANLALHQANREVNPDATWCIVGESVAINPAVLFPLTQQAGRNAIIVGAEDGQAASVLDTITASFVRDTKLRKKQRAKVLVIQGAKPTDARALALPKRWGLLDCDSEIADTRQADQMLKALHEELQRRVGGSEEDGSLLQPILLNIIQLGRLRSLKKEDEFSFGEAELTPDKVLEEILRDGPSHGIHVVLWAESYSTVSRWLSRNAMREIEIRLLMQMSGNDSTNLVDSVAASRLGDHVMLLHDEATGQDQRFRPFDCDTLGSLNKWSALLDE
ncbi:MAG: hypothetical protein KDB22_19090 [Planctomycetales bacterium]|nr:hypothetical protein [Planctomycetales bacterium]